MARRAQGEYAGRTVTSFATVETALSEATSRATLLRKKSFADALQERVSALMPAGRILSLDVFDTLLVRDASSELARFVAVADRMAAIAHEKGHTVSAGDAFTARHLGTRASYRAGRAVDGAREGSILEIHETASRLLTGTPALAEAFIAAELDNEVPRLSLHPVLAEIAAAHVAAGGRLTVLTDMYLHAGHVTTLLERLGFAVPITHLSSSADTKASKASGGAFALVEAALGAAPGDFLHVGDSLRGDFQRPKAAGWEALHLPIPSAEILARRRDHVAAAERLKAQHGITAEVAMPT